MSFGKLMAVAVVGGAMLVGCGNKQAEDAAKPTRAADGSMTPEASKTAQDLQKKVASDKTLSNEATQMKDKAADAKDRLSEAAKSAGDSAKSGMDAAKDKMGNMMGTTTQPAK